MIESRFGKIAIASSLFVLAALLVVVAPLHKRRGFYAVSSGFALAALYVAVRVKTWAPDPPSSIVGDADQFIADHAAHIDRFEAWGTRQDA